MVVVWLFLAFVSVAVADAVFVITLAVIIALAVPTLAAACVCGADGGAAGLATDVVIGCACFFGRRRRWNQ